MKLEFIASELKRLLGNASVFACKDKTLPTLCNVNLEWHEGELYFVGNNRYMQSQERADCILIEGEPQRFAIKDSDVKQILKEWPKALRGDARATVEYEPESGWFIIDVNPERPGNVQFCFDASTDSFTKWRMIANQSRPKATSKVAFNAQFLALFSKAKVEAEFSTMLFTFSGEDKPSFVQMGSDFTAAIMPIRNAG